MSANAAPHVLYGQRNDWHVQKVLVAANYAGMKLRLDDKTDAETVKQVTGQSRLPVLVLASGGPKLSQSNSMLRFVARTDKEGRLYGGSPADQAMVDQWIDFSLNELEQGAAVLTFPLLGCRDFNPTPEATAVALRDVLSALATMNEYLLDHTYLVNDLLSVADVACACACVNLFRLVLTEKHRSELTNVVRWFYTCVNQPQFRSVVGAVPEAAVDPAATGAGETKAQAAAVGAPATSRGPASTSPAVVNVEYNTTLPGGGKWRRKRTRVRELVESTPVIGSSVTVSGWVKRLQKNMRFMHINDGSTRHQLQIVLQGEETVGIDELRSCGGTDACVTVEGVVREGRRAEDAVEVHASRVTVHGRNTEASRYPIAKGRQGINLETLRRSMHLRVRTSIMSSVMRIRNACAYATHRFFQQRGFQYVHTPIITASDCEGAGEMFAVTTLLEKGSSALTGGKNGKPKYKKDFFKKPSFLTVSGQLNVETYCCALSDVYTFGPTFRAEDSHTSRHLAEFWMIEPEIAFADLDDDAALAEDYLKYCIQFCLDNCMSDIEFLNGKAEARAAALAKAVASKDENKIASLRGLVPQLENLRRVVGGPFARMTYTEAIAMLQEHVAQGKVQFDPEEEKKEPLEWGLDLRSEHERYLSEQVFQCPVIVTDYPKSFKAFYMRLNDDNRTVRAMDILAPGIGEIIGGSQREERLDVLERRIREQGQEPEMYSWYVDLRKFGTVPHSGFGLGFERLVQYVSGVENIRDVIPFPRYPGSAEF